MLGGPDTRCLILLFRVGPEVGRERDSEQALTKQKERCW